MNAIIIETVNKVNTIRCPYCEGTHTHGGTGDRVSHCYMKSKGEYGYRKHNERLRKNGWTQGKHYEVIF